jgi:hypothetical protein
MANKFAKRSHIGPTPPVCKHVPPPPPPPYFCAGPPVIPERMWVQINFPSDWDLLAPTQAKPIILIVKQSPTFWLGDYFDANGHAIYVDVTCSCPNPDISLGIECQHNGFTRAHYITNPHPTPYVGPKLFKYTFTTRDTHNTPPKGAPLVKIWG